MYMQKKCVHACTDYLSEIINFFQAFSKTIIFFQTQGYKIHVLYVIKAHEQSFFHDV